MKLIKITKNDSTQSIYRIVGDGEHILANTGITIDQVQISTVQYLDFSFDCVYHIFIKNGKVIGVQGSIHNDSWFFPKPGQDEIILTIRETHKTEDAAVFNALWVKSTQQPNQEPTMASTLVDLLFNMSVQFLQKKVEQQRQG